MLPRQNVTLLPCSQYALFGKRFLNATKLLRCKYLPPVYAAARIYCYPFFEYNSSPGLRNWPTTRHLSFRERMWFNKWRLCLNEGVGSVRGNVRTLIKEICCYMWLHADRMASYVDNSFRHAIMKNPADRTQQVRDHCCLDREHTRFWDTLCVCDCLRTSLLHNRWRQLFWETVICLKWKVYTTRKRFIQLKLT